MNIKRLTGLMMCFFLSSAIMLQMAQAQSITGEVNNMEYSPASHTLAVAATEGIWLYDVDSPDSEPLTLEKPIGLYVTSMRFSVEGTLLATAYEGNTIGLWEVETGTSRAVLSSHGTPQNGSIVRDIALSVDGTLLAGAFEDGMVYVWDTATGSELQIFIGRNRYAWSVAISPDNSLVAIGYYDGSVTLREIDSGRQTAQFQAHQFEVLSLAFNADGMSFATVSYRSPIRFWDAVTGELVSELGEDVSASILVFNQGSTQLVSYGIYGFETWLWDIASAEGQRIADNGDGIWCVVYDTDGTLLVCQGWEDSASLRNIETGEVLFSTDE